jgi:hypothetical protein
MPLRTALWRVGPQPQRRTGSALATEQLLEDMVVFAPELLSDEWMLIGRQEDTGFGGRVEAASVVQLNCMVSGAMHVAI